MRARGQVYFNQLLCSICTMVYGPRARDPCVCAPADRSIFNQLLCSVCTMVYGPCARGPCVCAPADKYILTNFMLLRHVYFTSQNLYLDFTARTRPFDRPLYSRISLDEKLWIVKYICVNSMFSIFSKNRPTRKIENFSLKWKWPKIYLLQNSGKKLWHY